LKDRDTRTKGHLSRKVEKKNNVEGEQQLTRARVGSYPTRKQHCLRGGVGTGKKAADKANEKIKKRNYGLGKLLNRVYTLEVSLHNSENEKKI